MKRIGLLGGMSWESSAEYYRFVNEEVRDRLGGLHSADCIMRSVEFAEIEELQRSGAWDEAGERLAAEAAALVAAARSCWCSAPTRCTRSPTGSRPRSTCPSCTSPTPPRMPCAPPASRVGLLATAYTMEQDFYVGRLRERHGLDVLVPEAEDRALVHRVIYDELCRAACSSPRARPTGA